MNLHSDTGDNGDLPNPHIRLATPDDAADIQAIYAPVVRDTVISFEYEEPTVEEMARRITKIRRTLPWLAWVERNAHGVERVVGYAYAGAHRDRAAYQWSVDLSAYVHADWRGRGVGKALYTALIGMLRELGYVNIYAGITLPNAASVALHESIGMRPVGVYRHVGYKFGAWHDVGWWSGELQPPTDAPHSPRSLTSAEDSPSLVV
jgi:L-amino acid N-acyltransferase YncA